MGEIHKKGPVKFWWDSAFPPYTPNIPWFGGIISAWTTTRCNWPHLRLVKVYFAKIWRVIITFGRKGGLYREIWWIRSKHFMVDHYLIWVKGKDSTAKYGGLGSNNLWRIIKFARKGRTLPWNMVDWYRKFTPWWEWIIITFGRKGGVYREI